MSYPGLDAKKLNDLQSYGLGALQLEKANEKAIVELDETLAKMTVNQWAPNYSDWNGKSLNLLLLGKTGSGKSATGNLLLGSTSFVESRRSESCTATIQSEHCIIDGINVNIIDTPGLMDTARDATSIITEIAKVFDEYKEGIHGLLFVYNSANPRYTDEEKAAFNQIEKGLLGPKFLDHCFIVITHGQGILKDESLEQYMRKEERSEFGRLLCVLVRRRVILVDNAETTEYGREGQRRQVVSLIASHLQPTSVYTNEAMEKYREDQKKLTLDLPEAIRSVSGMIDKRLSDELCQLSALEMRHMGPGQKRAIINSVVGKVRYEKYGLSADELMPVVASALDNKLKRYTDASFLETVAMYAVPILTAAGVVVKEAAEALVSGLEAIGSTVAKGVNKVVNWFKSL